MTDDALVERVARAMRLEIGRPICGSDDEKWAIWEKVEPRAKEYWRDFARIAIRTIATAQGIEAREGGDVQQAPREAREPGPKDAPKRSSHETRRA